MNNRGFSLVQIIISLGLLSGLFVAALKMIQNQTELGKSSSYRFESLVIMDEIKSTLSDPNSCRETLANLSGIFDEVNSIKSYDPRSKKSDIIYSTYKTDSKTLGQNNLYLQSMVLNGEIKGFGNEHGFTAMVMTFSDSSSGGETFRTVFPIQVELNELGKILNCSTRPGIHQEKSSRAVNDPWGKIKDESGRVTGISFTEGSITIGQVPGLAALNSEGGILLEDYTELGECSALTAGTLAFHSKKQILYLCGTTNKWQALHSINNIGKFQKEYMVQTTKNAPKVITTQEGFHVCRLVKSDTEGGQCSASPVNKLTDQPQWELLGQNYRDGTTSCLFKCFR